MLRYLIMVTESLLTTGILVGLLYAYIPMICEKRGRNILWGGLILGAVAAIVMAIMKNTTSKVVTGLWNLRIFTVSVAALILFVVFSALRKKLGSEVDQKIKLFFSVIYTCYYIALVPFILKLCRRQPED